MENPLELPAPPENDPVQRVHDFARDLAYGAIHGQWSSKIAVIEFMSGKVSWRSYGPDSQLEQYLVNKWENNHPTYELMLSFEYFSVYEEKIYLLTEKAFTLLSQSSKVVQHRDKIGGYEQTTKLHPQRRTACRD